LNVRKALENEKVKLEKQANELRQEIKQCRDQLQITKNLLEVEKKEKVDLLKRNEMFQKQVNILKSEIDEWKKNDSKMKGDISKINQEKLQFIQQFNSANNALEEEKKQKSLTEKNVEDLKLQMKTLQSEVEEWKKYYSEIKSKMDMNIDKFHQEKKYWSSNFKMWSNREIL